MKPETSEYFENLRRFLNTAQYIAENESSHVWVDIVQHLRNLVTELKATL